MKNSTLFILGSIFLIYSFALKPSSSGDQITTVQKESYIIVTFGSTGDVIVYKGNDTETYKTDRKTQNTKNRAVEVFNKLGSLGYTLVSSTEDTHSYYVQQEQHISSAQTCYFKKTL